MFRSHKQLIRTPTEKRGPRRTEFTPVGATGDDNSQLVPSAAVRTNVNNGSPMNRNFSADNLTDNTSSSFSALLDSPARPLIHKGTDIFPIDSSDEEENNSTSTFHGRRDLVGSKTTLVKKQADEVQKLRTDNFNLRVELISLKKGLQILPKDKKHLIDENMILNQKVIQLQRMVGEYHDREDSAPVDHSESIRKSNEAKIEEYENRLAGIREEVEEVRRERDNSETMRQELQDEVSSLKLQVAELHEELSKRPRFDEADAKDDKILELQTDLDHSESEADKLRRENDALNDRMKDLEIKVSDDTWKDDMTRLENRDKLLQKENNRLHERIKALKTGKEKTTDLMKGEIDNVYDKANKFQGEKAELVEKLRSMEDLLADAHKRYSDDYVEDIEADRKDLYNNLLSLNEKYKKLSEESQRKDQQMKKLKELKSHDSNISEELQLQLKEERRKFSEKQDQLLDEISQLKEERSDLVRDYQSIQIELESMKTDRRVDPEQFDKLESDFLKVSSQLKVQGQEYELLEDQLDIKEDELQKLRIELVSGYDKKEVIRLQKIIDSDKEERLKLLREKERLVDENLSLSEQVTTLKNVKDRLKTRMVSTTDAEDKLDELRKKNSKVLKDSRAQSERLQHIQAELDKISEEKVELLESLTKLGKTLQKTMDKNNQLSEQLRSIHNATSTSKQDLQAKLAEKNAANKKLVDEYNSMKNELLDRLESSRDEKKQLESKINELKEQIERHKVKEDILLQDQEKVKAQASQKIQYPPTPKTPNHAMEESSTVDALEARLELLGAQRKLYRIKLQDMKDANGDLKFANGYLTKELKSKDRLIEKNVTLLQASSMGLVTPESSPRITRKSQRTFEGCALAVLAGIRLQHRLEELKRKKNRERQAKAQIIQQQKYI
ncbi:hypothetical protein FOA43_003709 [Brettanomyces nanus]|uniref:Uncharacterized protein n=1 Tax=Eeniella nana TaxID=13502 RepID=A0A875S5X0_EENNA|nr:uncharacterized protein FOA43_003709 [Brettanomyces nanus]QPG76323.1 hypothetical protein FOA43_003709 [Brettanomyces nanus]